MLLFNRFISTQLTFLSAVDVILRHVKPISQLRFDYDTTISRYDAFDYDGNDRNYDLR